MMKTKYNHEEIIKDFATLTNAEIAQKHGITSWRYVNNLRKKYGAPLVKKTKDYAATIASHSDSEAAEILGVTKGAIIKFRQRNSIENKSSRRVSKEECFKFFVASKVCGVTEYPINGFFVDVLAGRDVIECKFILSRTTLQMAIGQLSMYLAELGEGYKPYIAYAVMHAEMSDHLIEAAQKAGYTFLHYPEYTGCKEQE